MKYIILLFVVSCLRAGQVNVHNATGNPVHFALGDGAVFVGPHATVLLQFTVEQFPALGFYDVIALDGDDLTPDLFLLSDVTTVTGLENVEWSIVIYRASGVLTVTTLQSSKIPALAWAIVVCFSCGLILGWFLISPLEVM